MFCRPEKPKTLKRVFLALVDDIVCHHAHYSEDEHKRDITRIRARLKHEGVAFLTKSLSLLGEALDKGLLSGQFSCPTNFSRYKKTALPRLFRGLLTRVFDDLGCIRSCPEVEAITDLRQLLFFCKKMRRPYTEKQLRSVQEQFQITDASLPSVGDYSRQSKNLFWRARGIIQDIFRDFDPTDIIPRHGSGAVATGEREYEKNKFSRLYARIHEVYPYYRYNFVNSADLLSRSADYRSAQRLECGQAKVVAVPKDSRGPRLISEEPLEYQFFQQGLMRAMYSHIESHPITKGFVNFTDQSVNQSLALESSKDGYLATLDFSEASDRVSVEQVEFLFGGVPTLLKSLMALRSPKTVFPDGTVVDLKKYASMGSALCFPVESICFFAVSYALLQVSGIVDRPHVYGDDLILPSHLVPLFAEVCNDIGWVLNARKSCYTGNFRESCGLDAFNGTEVTPTRLRVDPDGNGTDVSDIVSLVSTSNQLWSRCYYRASTVIAEMVERKLHHRLPLGEGSDSHLTLFTRQKPTSTLRRKRWNQALQRNEIRGLVPVSMDYVHTCDDHLNEDREYFRKHTQGWSPDYSAHRYVEKHSLFLRTSWVWNPIYS